MGVQVCACDHGGALRILAFESIAVTPLPRFGSTISPGAQPARLHWFLRQRGMRKADAARSKLQALDRTIRAFAPLHPARSAGVSTRAAPFSSSWRAYANETTRQLLVPNVTVGELPGVGVWDVQRHRVLCTRVHVQSR